MNPRDDGKDDSSVLAIVRVPDEPKPGTGEVILISIVDRHYFDASRFFCANAYPKHVEKLVNTCATRLGQIGFLVRLIQSEVQIDSENFLKIVSEDKIKMLSCDRKISTREKMKCPVDLPWVANSHGNGVLTTFHSMLFSTKSFLDAYASLISILISGKQSIQFSKGTVGGIELSGGKLINWLRRSSPSSFKRREDLARLTEANSKRWITKLVNLRDVVCHKHDLSDIENMSIDIPESATCYKDLPEPRPWGIRGEGTMVDYAKTVYVRLCDFVRKSVILLPEADVSKLSGVPKRR